jgi:hypothetical protein
MLLQGDLWLTAIFNKHSGDLQAVHFFEPDNRYEVSRNHERAEVVRTGVQQRLSRAVLLAVWWMLSA